MNKTLRIKESATLGIYRFLIGGVDMRDGLVDGLKLQLIARDVSLERLHLAALRGHLLQLPHLHK